MDKLASDIDQLEWNILSIIDEIALNEHVGGSDGRKLKEELSFKRKQLKTLYNAFRNQCSDFFGLRDY